MRVLLVGGGGREHALATAIARSPRLEKLFIAPGNPGTGAVGQNVPVKATGLTALVDVATHERVDLAVIGPEAPLALGAADALRQAGIAVFGPGSAAARIESSKAFAKGIMAETGVPTPTSHVFDQASAAASFVRASGQGWVVKADGLAAGKGVVVARDMDSTLLAIEQLAATPAAHHLLLEPCLEGPELSVIALCDGQRLLPLPPARDYKRLRTGNAGPNTGGMGAYAPVPEVSEELFDLIIETALRPVVARLFELGTPFVGALYAGLMLTDQGPRVLEFNCRFGDPEAQVLLPLLDGDLLEALHACALGRLDPEMLRWRDQSACCVVLAAPGYPDAPVTGGAISGLEGLNDPDVQVYHAGTAWERGAITVAGGRVLGVTGLGNTLQQARERAYQAVDLIHFDGKQFRDDIGA